jgi:hypothetical protein
MVKLGLADPAHTVDSAAAQKYESIFAGPLSESKHEAFKVLFPNNAFLDNFAPDILLAEPTAERDEGWLGSA